MTLLRSLWTKGGRVGFRTRLGTFIALAVGITVALASLASYITVRHQLFSNVDSSLRGDLAAARSLTAGGAIDSARAGSLLRRMNQGFLQVITPSGVASSTLNDLNPDSAPLQPNGAQLALAESGQGLRIDTMTYDGAHYRVLTTGVTILNGPFSQTTGAVQIGRSVADIDRTLSTLRIILWLVTLGGVAFAVGLGVLIGRETMRPVQRLTRAAEHVAATQDLESTIEVEGEDELARLARSFNSMLSALAASRQQQAQLISDAGHELRTPLTSLRTNIELLLRRPDLPSRDRAELTGDVEAQLQELTTLIGDLVDLARQEERQPEPLEVRFDAVVAEAVERARRRAPGIHFDVHLTPGSVRAQPALLERAVLNVLDNAAKWSPPGGPIEVWLQRGAVWTLDIHDHGPGIAPEDRPYVFDRFYRAASARALPGSGLGLAIVAQVIRGHGGTVSVQAPPEGGTVVHVELPIVTEVEADPPAADRESPASPSPESAFSR